MALTEEDNTQSTSSAHRSTNTANNRTDNLVDNHTSADTGTRIPTASTAANASANTSAGKAAQSRKTAASRTSSLKPAAGRPLNSPAGRPQGTPNADATSRPDAATRNDAESRSEADTDREHRELFGEAIRRVRLARGLSQEELAHLSGIDRSYMGRIERGEQALSIDKIWHIADALGRDPADLFSISLDLDNMRRNKEQDKAEGFTDIDLGTNV